MESTLETLKVIVDVGPVLPRMIVQEFYGQGDNRRQYDYVLREGGSGAGQLRESERKHKSAGEGRRFSRWLGMVFRSLFLPVGYPDSVSPDYAQFQVWDTIQALCSYLRGLLCTQALLVGVGVGSADASATNATIQWILRDGAGMIGGMLFAWRWADGFGHEAKRWRMFADCINDVGLTLELVSPLFPERFLLLACAGSICRALCGVAAGASRSALMNHFARQNNVADLTAKEGIQETAVTLMGLVAGLQFSAWLNGSLFGTWCTFILLTLLHVYANYRGLRGLVLHTLNPQRTIIIMRHFIQHQVVVSPRDVSRHERIFWMDTARPAVQLGVPFHLLVRSRADFDRMTGSDNQHQYVLESSREGVRVAFHSRATAKDILAAMFQAELVRHAYRQSGEEAAANARALWRADSFEKLFGGLEAAGWDVRQLRISTGAWRADWRVKQAAL